MSVYDMLLSFFTYSFLGWCAEVAFAAVRQRQFVNRGFLNGPLCPIYGIGVTAVVTLLAPYTDHLLVLYVMSALLVTLLEYVTGALLEKIFHLKWWDYSNMPLNIKGYVCIPFSLIWGVACVTIAKLIHPLIMRVLSWIPEVIGIIILIICIAALAADLSVTAGGILKWNHRMDRMKEIADELHRLSDQIGENIYQNMMNGLEKQGELKKRADALKTRYEDMLDHQNQTGRRLLKAFPQMKSEKYEQLIAEMKNRRNRKNGDDGQRD